MTTTETSTAGARRLELGDIADVRAYERERAGFRARIIALKKRRRVGVGPFVTLVFENRDTIRFQIQEMARVERIISDEGIQAELDVYNALIPAPGQLSATLFIELTGEVLLREWLPRLVGIERSIRLRLPGGVEVAAGVEEEHETQLTRSDTTSSVHYIRFELADEAVSAFGAGPVELAVDHPDYRHSLTLGADTVAELLTDLRP